ncbi:MAG: sugar transferase [Armatimonadota bacterium]
MVVRSRISEGTTGIYPPIKRAIDVLGGLVLLVVLSPLLALVALVIRLDSPGPAIYRQERVGRRGTRFTMLKFRTMKVGTPVLSTAEMQRQPEIPFTRVGPLLRKTNIDELPQLVNVIRGEMSFIGPRPALPSQTDVVTLREQSGADAVRPGITGLAQVMGRDDLEVHTKVSYDTEYCRRLSLALDLKILLLTFVAVFSARGNK